MFRVGLGVWETHRYGRCGYTREGGEGEEERAGKGHRPQHAHVLASSHACATWTKSIRHTASSLLPISYLASPSHHILLNVLTPSTHPHGPASLASENQASIFTPADMQAGGVGGGR